MTPATPVPSDDVSGRKPAAARSLLPWSPVISSRRAVTAAAVSGQALTLRRHEGYDHSYWFIETFVGDHLAWHAQRLR